ncbi:MAG TPA: hypothetical protein DEA55_03800 [Rhodospirillaceae bacterium]|nr:hypothetical protein [Rhodospirillaceae bacterium]
MVGEKAESAARAESSVAKEDKTPSRGNAYAAFGDNIDVNYGKPLPQYNNGPVKAYEARGAGSVSKNLFALVCENHLMPRLKSIQAYKLINSAGLPKLVRHGVMYWPPTKEERYALVYEDINGVPLMGEDNKGGLGWKQDVLTSIVLPSLAAVLQDMRNKDFVHGCIRPYNMFGTGSGKIEKVVLGDCLSMPPSYSQSVVYETIQRGMADPIGRGKGELSDDMYSLGASLAVLMRVNDPLAGLDDKEILRKKLELGSFSAITGRERIVGAILELLRGLLHDDASQRWSIEEVLLWIDGRRINPKQAIKRKKAPRPIMLGEKKYLQLPFLAMDMSEDYAESQKIIEDGTLEQWLERSLEDDATAARMREIVKSTQDSGHGSDYAGRLVSNVAMVLDPSAPVRYKGISAFGEGFGAVLAEQMVLKKDIKSYIDVINSGIVINWAREQDNPFTDVAGIVGRFDAARNALRQSKAGYGIERCLYILNSESPCLSDRFSGFYVMSPEDMVIAFEKICQKGDAPGLFIDRHCAAFLSAKDRKVIENYLYDIGASEEHKKVLGNIKCIGAIQRRASMPAMPALAKALEARMPAVYKRYHDRDMREKMEKTIKRLADSGDIAKMAALLDNPQVTEKDHGAFRAAMKEYLTLKKEDANLELKLADKKNFGRKTGQDVSAVLSSLISTAIILCLVFLFVTGSSIF